MRARRTVAIVAATVLVLALLAIRTFAASMTLVFGVLAAVAFAVARDAFVPDPPEARRPIEDEPGRGGPEPDASRTAPRGAPRGKIRGRSR